MTDNALGLYIAQHREANGISQKRLADAVGISRPYLTQIENGSRTPSDEVFERLLHALGIPLERAMNDLLEGSLDPQVLEMLSGPAQAVDLLSRYLTPEQLREVMAAFGSREQIAAMAQVVVNEQPISGGPDRWLELSKKDRALVNRLVNRLADGNN